MIKSDVKVCGKVDSAPRVHTNIHGTKYTYFRVAVQVPVIGSSSLKTIFLAVMKDGEDEELLNNVLLGQRVKIEGSLLFKNSTEGFFLNLFLKSFNGNVAEDEKDSIRGTMEFRGRVGKYIKEQTSFDGTSHLSFSANSFEKADDGKSRRVWVCLKVSGMERPEWLCPSAFISTQGEMEINILKNRPNIVCHTGNIAQFIPQRKETT